MKFLFSILLGLIFWGGQVEANKEKTFVVCLEGSPSVFNPQLATDGPTFKNTHHVYNGLVEFKYGETSITPGLAKSWKVSKDELKFTFYLRKGVKWHTTKRFKPSRDFNADDVIWTFKRPMDKSHPYHKVSGGTYEYFQSMGMGGIIKDVRKKDDYTVEFILNRKEAPFLANLAMDFAVILSKEYGEKMLAAKTPDHVDNFPVGTGPFIFQRYQKDTIVRYKKNKDYFLGPAKIDNLVMLITPDPSVRFQKLKVGECHLSVEPAPADIALMKKHKSLKVLKRSGLNVGYLAFNTEKKPFDNVKVRRAINYALNKPSYIDAIYLGHAQVAKNPIPPTIWSYNDSVKDYPYNLKKAKKLLKEAGYPKGFKTDLWVMDISRPYNPNGKKLGEMMQADLAKVGIQAKIVTYDWPTYLSKTAKGEHQMLQLGWSGDNGDPDNFLNVLLSCGAVKAGSNRARWCHKPFDNLIKRAKETTILKKRISYYKKAQKVFKDQAPWVTIAHAMIYRGLRKNVKGFKINPFGVDYINNEVDLK